MRPPWSSFRLPLLFVERDKRSGSREAISKAGQKIFLRVSLISRNLSFSGESERGAEGDMRPRNYRANHDD